MRESSAILRKCSTALRKRRRRGNIVANMQWSDLVPLLAVARRGSLGAAARELRVAPTTVGRRLEALQQALGLRLIERDLEGVRLTAHGLRMVELAEQVEDRATALERAAIELRQEGLAIVRVSATEIVIADILAPALEPLLARAPALKVELTASAEVVSLARRDADLAVRMVRPEGQSLLTRKLATIRLGLFASRRYLARRRPAELMLTQERLLGYDDSYGPIPEVRWIEQTGLASALVLRTSSTRALLAAAHAGVGVAMLPVMLAKRDASLVEVPAPRPLPARTPWLVLHPDLRGVPAIRAVASWIVQTFAQASRESSA